MDGTNIPFIGTGWSFPPEFGKGTGVATSTGAKDIEESLYVLLSTKEGERLFVPDFGCDMTTLLFEPLDLDLEKRIEDLMRKAILLYETRISVEDIVFDYDRERGVIRIDIQYIIRTTNTRTNIVYPFYLTEGTNL